MTRESYNEAVADTEAAIRLQCKILQGYDTTLLALAGDEKTLTSFHDLHRKWTLDQTLLHVPECVTEPHTDIGFRRWVTSKLLNGKYIDNVRRIINEENAHDRKKANAKLAALQDMLMESHLYITHCPPLSLQTPKDALYEFFYHAQLLRSSIQDNLFKHAMKSLTDTVERKKYYISTVSTECILEMLPLLRNLRFQAHIHNPTGSEQDSTIFFTSRYILKTDPPYIRSYSAVCQLHHVRINGNFSLYLHFYNAKTDTPAAYNAGVLWYKPADPSPACLAQLSEIIREGDHVKHRSYELSFTNVRFGRPDSNGDVDSMITIEVSDLNKKSASLLFRPCSLESDGPLPQHLLLKFVPPRYHSAADPYRPLCDVDANDERARFIRETTKLYENAALEARDMISQDNIRQNNYTLTLPN